VRALAFVEAQQPPADRPAAGPEAPAAPAAPTVSPMPAVAQLDTRRSVTNQDMPSVAPAPAPSAAPPAPAPAPPPATTPAKNLEPRTFVILVDDLSFRPLRGKNLFAAAQRFVNSVPRVDPVGFTTTSGTMTVNPTLDRKAVLDGLAKVVGEYVDPRLIDPSGRSFGSGKGSAREEPLGMQEAMMIERGSEATWRDVAIRECFNGDSSALPPGNMDVIAIDNACVSGIRTEARRTTELTMQNRRRQLASIASIMTAMRTAAGIRHLIVLTDGLALHLDVSELDQVTRAAASAGVQVSVLMEDPDATTIDQVNNREGGETSTMRVDPGLTTRVREDNKMMLSGAQTTAEAIGGIFYRFVGGADTAFARVLTASSAVYRLAVELPAGESLGKELSLGVNVKQPGLTVRANKTAVAVAPAPAKPAADPGPARPAAPMITGPVAASLDDVLKAALTENRSLRGVPMRLGAMVRRSTNTQGQLDLSVNVVFPSSVKTPITALVGIVDESNTLRVSRKVVDDTSAPVQFLFPLAAGNYAVRFGAAAADGALGTVELPVAVKLRTMGPYTASDVLLFAVGETSQKAALFAIDEAPAAREKSTIHASIELYPDGPMPDEPPVVNWTIVREGEPRPVFDEDSEGRVGGSLFRSDVELPLDTLAPGSYVVRATLMIGDKPAGTAAAVFRKR
jgi:hypothetical protein